MSIPSAGGRGSMGPVRRGDDPGAPFPRNAVVLAARVFNLCYSIPFIFPLRGVLPTCVCASVLP
ncbi:hypothetical protein [Enterobacter kobei]|uniref:hypothetical protein n=1 Tax=Enterobacter kobei TaxID=208224 RepID=UPI000FCAE8C3|nr:hypothetical protein [Enterobacter kobei]